MNYHVVVQMSPSSLDDFDRMIALEEELITTLGDVGEVDGHDAGQGEVNIFILTNEPRQIYERLRLTPKARDLMPELRIAYRSIDGDEFKILHPPGLTHFEVA